MEFEKPAVKPNPWTSANIISNVFFWWLTPVIIKGRNGNLKHSDIYDCPEVDTSENIGKRMEKEWDKELKKLKTGKQPSLVKATIRMFGLQFFLCLVLMIFKECVFQVLQPIMLGYLIQHFSRRNVLSDTHLYLTATAFCSMSFMFIFFHHPSLFRAQHIAMRLRIACCSLIYRKALKLSQASLGKTTVGQMVNLLSNDVNRFDQISIYFPFLLAGPLQAIITVIVLWNYIGYASLTGISFMIIYIPLQSLMGKIFSKLRLKTALLTDERIRLMNEIISGMRVIKMYGWEIPFAKLVDLKRRKEMKMIRATSIVRGFTLAAPLITSKIILLLAFVFFLLVAEGSLTPENVFVSMALFSNFDRTFIVSFPNAVGLGSEGLMSLKRIQSFLMLEEQTETSSLNEFNLRPKLKECGIWMNKVKASWNKEGEPTLNRVTLSVKPGELLAVVGPVGCGKSSLLLSILGELPIASGDMKIRGRVSYASQEAWVFGGSIKQNVVFGSEFDKNKYEEVIRVCALDKDIEQFPYGDQTAVGERGVILSGGQKARVNLARAMYFDADIFLLDDPLSAVDACVSKHLFEKCINGYLRRKIRILVTHQIQFLKNASQILVLKDGECLALGSYNELISAGVDLGSLMDYSEEDHRQRIRTRTSSTSSRADSITFESMSDDFTHDPLHEFPFSPAPPTEGEYEDVCTVFETAENAPKVAEEVKFSGNVSVKVYKQYLKAGQGPFLAIAVAVLFITTQALYNGSDFWLTKWTSLEQRKFGIEQCWRGINKTLLNQTGFYNDIYGIDPGYFKQTINNVSDFCFEATQNYTIDVYDADKTVKMNFRLSVYSGMVMGVLLLSLIRTNAFFEMCRRTSVSFHDKMFRSVLRSPIGFFDVNPLGRILNRFSKDAGIIDDTLSYAAHEAFRLLCNILGVICVVSIIVPYLLIPTLIVIAMILFTRQFCIPTLLDVKRYEGIYRSPVISHLSTSMYGLTTIRAFKVQQPFELSFDHHQDQHTATWFLFVGVIRWMGIVFDCLCIINLTCITAAMVILGEDPSFSSMAALALTQSMQLMGNFQYCVRQTAEVESQMTSVERVIEYTNLKPEADLDSQEDQKPPKNWPSKGCIVYRNVYLKYAPDEPPVLKNLNFEIYPEEKVGIVGRTGAGKSSMIATLFRMTEPEGEIIIDDICTKYLGLHNLRKKISIIPQDPILFTGPVRRNLDPFSEHDDSDLWQALDEAYMKEPIEEMPGGLDTEVSEGGNNFSVGQRQLLCLARAILRRNRILVLDEATANVDPNTDSLIQKTIRDRFSECTVLTIAHRLHTIMDSDRVLVYDAGEVKEFDEPYNLLQEKNSIFSQLVQMTGPAMAKQLNEMAHAAHAMKLNRKRGVTKAFRKPDDNDVTKMDDLCPIPENESDDGGLLSSGCVNEGYEHETTEL